jgi:hypothetical protein
VVFLAWNDPAPYKEMELKMVSGSNTEDYTNSRTLADGI